MTKSLVMWAVCEKNGKGWKPVWETVANTRTEAIERYEWGPWGAAMQYRKTFYPELRKSGKALAMRVEVSPIEPVTEGK